MSNDGEIKFILVSNYLMEKKINRKQSSPNYFERIRTFEKFVFYEFNQLSNLIFLSLEPIWQKHQQKNFLINVMLFIFVSSESNRIYKQFQ